MSQITTIFSIKLKILSPQIEYASISYRCHGYLSGRKILEDTNRKFVGPRLSQPRIHLGR